MLRSLTGRLSIVDEYAVGLIVRWVFSHGVVSSSLKACKPMFLFFLKSQQAALINTFHLRKGFNQDSECWFVLFVCLNNLSLSFPSLKKNFCFLLFTPLEDCVRLAASRRKGRLLQLHGTYLYVLATRGVWSQDTKEGNNRTSIRLKKKTTTCLIFMFLFNPSPQCY